MPLFGVVFIAGQISGTGHVCVGHSYNIVANCFCVLLAVLAGTHLGQFSYVQSPATVVAQRIFSYSEEAMADFKKQRLG